MSTINAKDLVPETKETLDGSENFVMFDNEEGKQGAIDVVSDYIVQHGKDADGKTLAESFDEKASSEDIIEINEKIDKNADNIASIPVDITEKDCFGETRQRVCKWYDTFDRADGNGFGDNGELMTWEQDYAQHISIRDKHLTVLSSIPYTKAIFTNAKDLGNDFCAEMPIDSGDVSYHGLVICGKDQNNYIYIRSRVVTNPLRYGVTVYKKENGGALTQVASRLAGINDNDFYLLSAHYYNGALYLYINGQTFMSISLNIPWTERKVGVIGIGGSTITYSSLAVFTFRDFVEYNTDIVDRGYKEPFTEIERSDDGIYSIVDSDISPKAEAHDLYRDDVFDVPSAHNETAYHDPDYQAPLAHVQAEFDKWFEDPFVIDKYREIIFQFHTTKSGTGLSPSCSVVIDGDEMQVRNLGSGDRNADASSELIPTVLSIGTVTPGWHHFKLDVHFGCTKYHNPRIDVWVDGQYKGTSLTPNYYAADLGPYYRYGVYKWDWKDKKDGAATERHYKTDNVKIIY